MADENSKSLCSLCFNFKLESPKSTEILEKIEKYLQLKMEYRWSGICLSCYNALEGFHDFYERVHAAQKIFQIYQLNQSQIAGDFLEGSAKTEFELNSLRSNQDGSNECLLGSKELLKINQTKCISSEQKFINGKFSEVCDDKNVSERTIEKGKRLSSEMETKMVAFYNIKCEKCGSREFKSFKMLSKHYTIIHKIQGYIKCCKRKIKINDKYYLRNHMLKHLEPDTCRCRICGKELSSLATLKHHMNLHKPEEERPFQCGECSKRFCCKNDMKNHEKSMHLAAGRREDFICDVCGKVFSKAANLRYHYSSVHLQEKKYICEICAKCFTTYGGLKAHLAAAHASLDPIQCQECHKWLKTKDTFQKHLQLHQNQTYPCTHCGKICNSSASLRSHLVKHSEERPHTCTVCMKAFKTKTHLKNHATQHGGGASYKCPYCPKLFVNMSNYYTHRRRMHSGKKENGNEGRASAENADLSGSELPLFDEKGKTTADSGSRGSLAVVQSPAERSSIIVSPLQF